MIALRVADYADEEDLDIAQEIRMGQITDGLLG